MSPSGGHLKNVNPTGWSALPVIVGYALLLGVAIAFRAYPVAALPLVLGVVALALYRRDWLLLGLLATVPLEPQLGTASNWRRGFVLANRTLAFWVDALVFHRSDSRHSPRC